MEYITKKELLEKTGISYGQLYRWKRMGMIPESWFIKRPSTTGQETVLPYKKITARIEEIQTLMKSHSLDDIVDILSADVEKEVIAFEDLYKSPYLRTEYVNAVGNYFKKPGYTACEYIMIICAADVARKERFTTRQYVDLLRYSLPVAARCTTLESRCIFFAAGGDWHVTVLDNKAAPLFDRGLRIAGNYNMETMWEKMRNDK
ncbi:MAG: DUF4004 family protein [Oscillospiraceae bacterium]|nr:DUF4004 family protein [Oscillospiraceae bacterium]